MTYRSSSPRAITRSAAIALLLAGAALPGAQAQGQGLGKDAPGSQDHPLLQRFTGSALIGYARADWDTARVPGSPQVGPDQKFKDLQTVEGKVTRLVYLAPLGKSPLEVYRNYEQALSAAGLKRKLSCEKDCYELYQAMGLSLNPTQGLTWTDKFYETKTGSTFQSYNALYYREARVLSGTLQRGGVETHVTMLTTKAGNDSSDYAATYLQIIEPKAMQTGQVTVDAKALQSGLQTDGKIALYGLFFDTGKAEIKPESKAQLDEMAKLLQGNAQLKVHIVGHTDNAGSLDANQSLSLARAQAVVAALSKPPYGIAAARLSARGVASLAPVASNADEAGRARNRRVELVQQ